MRAPVAHPVVLQHLCNRSDTGYGPHSAPCCNRLRAPLMAKQEQVTSPTPAHGCIPRQRVPAKSSNDARFVAFWSSLLTQVLRKGARNWQVLSRGYPDSQLCCNTCAASAGYEPHSRQHHGSRVWSRDVPSQVMVRTRPQSSGPVAPMLPCAHGN